MACFLVSAATAVVTGVASKAVEAKEDKAPAEEKAEVAVAKVPFSRKLKWLTYLLLGGAVLLMFEHIWHGEVVPWFPFLTAMSDPADTAEMLHEMATVGVTMAVLVAIVWVAMCLVADSLARRVNRENAAHAEVTK